MSSSTLNKHPNCEISVVVPVYNSEQILETLCSQLKKVLKGRKYQILLVNDASTDFSWTKIKAVGATDTNIEGILLRKNVGQDRAIMAGLNYARGDFVIIMDDDLQHSPADIEKLLSKISEGFDVCYATYTQKRQKLYKNIGSLIANKIANRVLGKPPEIYMSPFKILRKEVVREIIGYTGPFVYIDGLIYQITGNVTEISIEHHDRYHGTSMHTIWKQLPTFLTLCANYSMLPLRILEFIGLLFSFFCILAVTCIAAYSLFCSAKIDFSTLLLLINLIVLGVALFAIVFLAEYIGRILLTFNQPPQFVVKAVVNNKVKADDSVNDAKL